MHSNLNENAIVSNIKKLNYRDLIIFSIPFAIFMYYLYIYNPGIIHYDAYNQLHQIATHRFFNWHPFFHTFIEMICIKIYHSPLSVGVMQITVFSTMWMIICKYNRFEDVKIDKKFILQVIITLFIAIIPINGIYAITLGKDILFSYSILFLCFLIEVMVDRKSDISYPFAILMSLTMAFICQLRPNGTIVVLALLVIFAAFFFKRNRDKKLHLIIPIATIAFILLISSLSIVYDVENNQKDVILDKTAHILSFYDLNIEISDSDKQKINELVSQKDIDEHFNIHYTDPTYRDLNKTAYQSDKSTYIKMAIKYSLKNPLKFIEYVFISSAMVWDITRDSDWVGDAYKTDIESAKNSFYTAHNTHPAADIDNASAVNVGTESYNNLNSYVETFRDNHILDTLFYSPALYMYLAFVLLGIIYWIIRVKEIFLIYLPNLMNIFTITLSTPIQSNRYLYGNLLLVYLLLIMAIGLWGYKNDKLQERENIL